MAFSILLLLLPLLQLCVCVCVREKLVKRGIGQS